MNELEEIISGLSESLHGFEDDGKDKFGIETDGKGNVALQGLEFLDKALSLEGYKYKAFADLSHFTENEYVLLQENPELLKENGFSHVFLEVNPQELEKIQDNIAAGEVEGQDLKTVKALQDHGLEVVAVDSRGGGEIYKVTNLDKEFAYLLIEHLAHQVPEEEISEGELRSTIKRFFEDNELGWNKQVGIAMHLGSEMMNVPEYITIIEGITGVDYPSVEAVDLTQEALQEIVKENSKARDSIYHEVLKDAKINMDLADQENTPISQNILDVDEQVSQGLIVLGEEHFARREDFIPPDVDTTINMMVLAMAKDQGEVDKYLKKLDKNPNVDAADYIYNSASGKGISVEEYMIENKLGKFKEAEKPAIIRN